MGGRGADCIAFEDRPRAGQRMQSLPQDHQALEILNRLWQQFSQQLHNRLPKVEFTPKQVVTLTKLAGQHRREIEEAFAARVDAFEMRGSLLFSDVPARIVCRGIAEAVRVLAESPENCKVKGVRRTVVKQCVIRAIDEYLMIWDEWFSHAEPPQLLVMLLRAPQPVAERLIGRMTFEQAYKTLYLHVASVTGRRYFSYKPPYNSTPKNYLEWLALRLHDRIRHLLGESLGENDALFFWQGGHSMPVKNKDGKPINYADPINAKTIEMWDREMNKHGHLKDDPNAKGRIASAGRIADSLSPSAKEIRRYLKEDVPVALVPDGKGGVYIEVSDDGILASVETVGGHQPGRKPKHTP